MPNSYQYLWLIAVAILDTVSFFSTLDASGCHVEPDTGGGTQHADHHREPDQGVHRHARTGRAEEAADIAVHRAINVPCRSEQETSGQLYRHHR